jgi:uncharacterized protein YcaQ
VDANSARGEVAVAGRVGWQRLWDIAERVYPPVADVVPLAEARRVLAVRRLRPLGIARSTVIGTSASPRTIMRSAQRELGDLASWLGLDALESASA